MENKNLESVNSNNNAGNNLQKGNISHLKKLKWREIYLNLKIL
jgi:hypothetical protein